MGETGHGKSSFIKQIVDDCSIKIGGTQQSETRICSLYTNKTDFQFVDTPGFNDTKELKNNQILLLIVNFLRDIKVFENIFIAYIENLCVKRSNSIIRDFAFIYFLVEQFGVDIQIEMVNSLLEHYIQTREYFDLNSEIIQKSKENYYAQKRILLQHRDTIINLKEKFMNYHIVVRTFFDDEVDQYDKVDAQLTENEYLQIWSNNLSADFGIFSDHINNQEKHLFRKIAATIQREELVEQEKQNDEIEYVLLIAKSQTGKSSMIEQLTKLKGLRGTGQTSCTEYCKLYLVSDGQTKYLFIDPPGHQSSNPLESEFHSLKVLIDFMRRNKILNFRPIFLYSGNKEISPEVFRTFFQFLIKYLDQDVSRLLESELAIEINEQCASEEVILQLISQCLQIQRINKFKDINEVEKEKQNYLSKFQEYRDIKLMKLKFSTNINANKSVDSNIDDKQKQLLFTAIRDMKSLTLEDILSQKVQVLNTAKVFEENQDLTPTFEELFNLCKRILKLGENQEKDNDSVIRARIGLNKKMFIIMSNKWDDISNFVNKRCRDENIVEIQQIEDIKKLIYRRFLIINFTPILFESEKQSPKLLLSRQQMYFNFLSNKLKDFSSQMDDQFLIEMSAQMVRTELAFSWHTFQNLVDQSYNVQNFTEEQKRIQFTLAAINFIQGAGTQIYRYAKFFRSIQQSITQATIVQVYNSARFSQVTSAFSGILNLINIGIDIYSFQKGLIGMNNLISNSSFNVLGLISVGLGLCFSSLSIIFGVGAGVISLAGQLISSLNYTCSATFDETIRLFIKDIVDDQFSNQSLLSFQRSQFFKDSLLLTNPSDFGKSAGYDAYRMLEKKQDNLQVELLARLHKVSTESVIDVSANYVMKTYILSKLQKIPIKAEGQTIKSYFITIENNIKLNLQLINTFFNSFENSELKNQIQETSSSVEKLVNTTGQEIDDNGNQLIQQYNEQLNELGIQVTKSNYKKIELEKIADGMIRKADRFNLVYQGYSNLMDLKTKFIYKQNVLPFIQKDSGQNSFSFKESANYMSIFKNTNTAINTFGDHSIRQFTSSRYLNKFEGTKGYHFSFLSKEELFDETPVQSIDLYLIAEESFDLMGFKHTFEQQIQGVSLESKEELIDRAINFYHSFRAVKQLISERNKKMRQTHC